MKILLISESSTEDDIYRMIDQIIKIDKIIETHDISEELSYITDIRYDIIIINYPGGGAVWCAAPRGQNAVRQRYAL